MFLTYTEDGVQCNGKMKEIKRFKVHHFPHFFVMACDAYIGDCVSIYEGNMPNNIVLSDGVNRQSYEKYAESINTFDMVYDQEAKRTTSVNGHVYLHIRSKNCWIEVNNEEVKKVQHFERRKIMGGVLVYYRKSGQQDYPRFDPEIWPENNA